MHYLVVYARARDVVYLDLHFPLGQSLGTGTGYVSAGTRKRIIGTEYTPRRWYRDTWSGVWLGFRRGY